MYESGLEVVRHSIQPGLEVVKPISNVQAPLYDEGKQIDSGAVNSNNEKIYDETPSGVEWAQPRSRVCGLKRRTFVILCVVVGVIVVAAAVGIGLGVGLSQKSPDTPSTPSIVIATTATLGASASTATSTPTPTPSSDRFSQGGTLDLACPSINNSLYTSTDTTKTNFQIHCGSNYVVDPPAIIGFNITNINGCMDKCLSYNSVGKPAQKCVAITFQANLTEAEMPLQRANCWLAGTTGGRVNSNNLLLASAEILAVSN